MGRVKVPLEHYRQRVIEFLCTQDDPLSIRRITFYLRARADKIRDAVRSLQRKGLVRKSGGSYGLGEWVVTPKGRRHHAST